MTETFVPTYTNYHESNIKCNVDDIDAYGNWLAGNIRMYDPLGEHIGVLKDLLKELKRVLKVINKIESSDSDEMRYGIDMTSLPSYDLPDGISTDYPIWAIDFKGNVLVGESADTIEPITSIIAYGYYMGVGGTISYDLNDIIPFHRLQEPIRTWCNSNKFFNIGSDGFVYDNGKLLTWGELILDYGFDVWGIKP